MWEDAWAIGPITIACVGYVTEDSEHMRIAVIKYAQKCEW